MNSNKDAWLKITEMSYEKKTALLEKQKEKQEEKQEEYSMMNIQIDELLIFTLA